jgi:hypothetical protein
VVWDDPLAAHPVHKEWSGPVQDVEHGRNERLVVAIQCSKASVGNLSHGYQKVISKTVAIFPRKVPVNKKKQPS